MRMSRRAWWTMLSAVSSVLLATGLVACKPGSDSKSILGGSSGIADSVDTVIADARRVAKEVDEAIRDIGDIRPPGPAPDAPVPSPSPDAGQQQDKTDVAAQGELLTIEEFQERLSDWLEDAVRVIRIERLEDRYTPLMEQRVAELELTPLQQLYVDRAMTSPMGIASPETYSTLYSTLSGIDNELGSLALQRQAAARQLFHSNPVNYLPANRLITPALQHEQYDDLYRLLLARAALSSGQYRERHVRTAMLSYLFLAADAGEDPGLVVSRIEQHADRDGVPAIHPREIVAFANEFSMALSMEMADALLATAAANNRFDQWMERSNDGGPLFNACLLVLADGASPDEVRRLARHAPRLSAGRAASIIEAAIKEHDWRARGFTAVYEIDGEEHGVVSLQTFYDQLFAAGSLADANEVWARFMSDQGRIDRNARRVWGSNPSRVSSQASYLDTTTGALLSTAQAAEQADGDLLEVRMFGYREHTRGTDPQWLHWQNQLLDLAEHLKTLGASQDQVVHATAPFLKVATQRQLRLGGTDKSVALPYAMILARTGDHASAHAVLDAVYTAPDLRALNSVMPQVIRAELIAGREEIAQELFNDWHTPQNPRQLQERSELLLCGITRSAIGFHNIIMDEDPWSAPSNSVGGDVVRSLAMVIAFDRAQRSQSRRPQEQLQQSRQQFVQRISPDRFLTQIEEGIPAEDRFVEELSPENIVMISDRGERYPLLGTRCESMRYCSLTSRNNWASFIVHILHAHDADPALESGCVVGYTRAPYGLHQGAAAIIRVTARSVARDPALAQRYMSRNGSPLDGITLPLFEFDSEMTPDMRRVISRLGRSVGSSHIIIGKENANGDENN